MSDLLDELRQIRDTEIRELRERVGFPDPDDPDSLESLTPELIWKYIEELESTVIGQRMAMRSVGNAMHVASSCSHELPPL